MRTTIALVPMILILGPQVPSAGQQKKEDPKESLEQRIRRLVADLGHSSFRRREKATRELKAIGKPAVRYLEEAARSKDLEVRFRALKLLEALHVRVPKALLVQVKNLLAQMMTGRGNLRVVARQNLLRMGARSIPALGRLFETSKDYRWRRAIVEILTALNLEDSVALLIGALGDADRFVRSGAVAGLRALTRQKFASYEGDRWKKWYEVNRGKLPHLTGPNLGRPLHHRHPRIHWRRRWK